MTVQVWYMWFIDSKDNYDASVKVYTAMLSDSVDVTDPSAITVTRGDNVTSGDHVIHSDGSGLETVISRIRVISNFHREETTQ